MKKVKKIIKKLYNNKYFSIYLIIVLLFAMFLSSPFTIGYIFGDDTVFHYANVKARGESFLTLFGKIMPEIGYNFGYGTGIFYPPLPHVIGGIILMIISNFGFEAFGAIRVLKMIVIFASALTMYMFGNKLFNDRRKGMFASVIYITSSYFLVDNFVRDSLNESFTFIFIPLVFLGLYYLFNEKNKKLFYLFFIIGYVGMMYSHLVMSVWFTLFLILVLLLFIRNIFTKDNLVALFISAISILFLTSPFTIPMIEHMIGGNYSIFAGERTADGIWTLPFKGFVIEDVYATSTGKLFINFAPVVVALIILAVIKLIFIKNKSNEKFIIASLIFLILGILFTSCTSIWKYVPSFLLSIQFPWRLVGFATFGGSIVAVYGLDYLFYIFKKKFIPVASLILLFMLLIFTINNLSYVNFRKHIDTPDMNLGMGWQREYLPVKASIHQEYFDSRGNGIKITKGKAKISIIKNNVPNMKFKVSELDDNVIIELPRLYYLGYKIEDMDGNIINYKEDKYGFISLKITKNGIYEVSYVGTEGYKIGLILSGITIICWIGYVFYCFKKKGE